MVTSIVSLGCIAVWLASTGHIFLAAIFIICMVDLVMTVSGNPLFKPGPLAKLCHKNLSDDDGII